MCASFLDQKKLTLTGNNKLEIEEFLTQIVRYRNIFLHFSFVSLMVNNLCGFLSHTKTTCCGLRGHDKSIWKT